MIMFVTHTEKNRWPDWFPVLDFDFFIFDYHHSIFLVEKIRCCKNKNRNFRKNFFNFSVKLKIKKLKIKKLKIHLFYFLVFGFSHNIFFPEKRKSTTHLRVFFLVSFSFQFERKKKFHLSHQPSSSVKI